jgi:hypothetical protein
MVGITCWRCFVCVPHTIMRVFLASVLLGGDPGTRLVICHKNTGKPKYAFNSVQAVWLPKMYQPPEATRATAGEIDT